MNTIIGDCGFWFPPTQKQNGLTMHDSRDDGLPEWLAHPRKRVPGTPFNRTVPAKPQLLAFSYTGDDEDYRLQYANYYNHPEWPRIYAFLQRGYWHVTSPSAWRGIQESGAIRPNLDGRYPMRFDFETRRSFGFLHGFICLFDFISPTEEEVIRTWDRAWSVLVDSTSPPTILLQLDVDKLRHTVIPNSEGYNRPDGQIFGVIPHCEAWSREEIGLNSVMAVYELGQQRSYSDFSPLPMGWNRPSP